MKKTNILFSFLPREISPAQCKDTGMAMTFICLLVFAGTGHTRLIWLAGGLLLIDMVWPKLFRPIGFLWFGLSTLLGTIVSRILLSIIFFGLVTPLGLLKRMTGSEPLQISRWKKDTNSAFHTRDITFSAKDIEKPY